MKRVIFTNYFERKSKKNYKFALEVATSAFLGLFVVGIFLFTYVSYQAKKYADALPQFSEIKARITDNSQNSHVYDRNGKLLYTFVDPNSDREYAKIEEIPSIVKWTLIAAEDKNFYDHHGIDYTALARSIFLTVGSNGENLVGGSTITQQLVKNTVLSNERTIDRKIKEMLVSFYIEQEYDKDYILELYLNSAPFGGRIIGIKTAARTYFNKDLKDLTVRESVFLISLIQSPGKSSPLYSTDTNEAWVINNSRSDYIFSNLRERYDYIKEHDPNFVSYETISDQEGTTVNLNPSLGEIHAPHFVFYIKDLLTHDPYNIPEEELYTGGYKIYTSLDLDMQTIAEADLKWGVERYKNYGMSNGSLITIDPTTGDLLAMVGSKDYFGVRDENGRFDPQVNVTTSKRNVGSTLKPFIAYEAFHLGIYGYGSIVTDEPFSYGGYAPKNYDGKFLGSITVATALQESRNIPFVKILKNVGVANVLDLMDKLGYKGAADKDRYGLALALGGFDSTLLEHTHAYAAFANAGSLAHLRPVLRIEDSNGNVLQKYDVVIDQNVMDPKTVTIVNSILSSYGPYGISGKTGTTDYNKDNYFIGYNDKFVTGMWMGNNNNARMHPLAFGSTTVVPVWSKYYVDVKKDFPQFDSSIPNTLPAPPKPKPKPVAKPTPVVTQAPSE